MTAEQSRAERIFVAVGTSLDPFDRLLRLLDELRESGEVGLPIFAQSGSSRYRPRSYPCEAYLRADEMEAQLREARVIVCHGGAGILGTCLQLRRRPVVFPRRVGHGEIVNDHQLELCQEMLAQDRIYLAEDRAGLLQAIKRALADREVPPPPGGDRLRAAIGDLLRRMAG